VADVMAGVGPFAIPAAKKGCRVLGNDLNPEGVKWMSVNREKNKVSYIVFRYLTKTGSRGA
jgi:tRNA (guanine37-N1)-methyltransferase